MLDQIYRVSLDAPDFHSSQKWSERLGRTFRRQGKRWDERIEEDVKKKVSEAVCANPGAALLAVRTSIFDGLVRNLETRVNELSEHFRVPRQS
jgi:hypothetical protein